MEVDCQRRHMLQVFDKKVIVYPSAVSDRPVIYLHTVGEVGEQVYEGLRNEKCTDVTLVVVSNLAWNHDMSPWEIPPVWKDKEPFTGGAGEYVKVLVGEIVPRAEAFVRGHVLWRGLAGYSLAGLFSIYSLYQTEFFSRAASISGSLWYPGVVEYITSHEIKSPLEHLYLSLGNRERRVRNPYLSAVQINTENIRDYYMKMGIDTVFCLNQGNHFQDVVQRTASGIAWMSGR